MNTNFEKLVELRNSFVETIENAATSKLTPDNTIVFNEPLCVVHESYDTCEWFTEISLGDNEKELLLSDNGTKTSILVELDTDTLAQIADIIQNGEYSVEDI